jgi:hypothetical protein
MTRSRPPCQQACRAVAREDRERHACEHETVACSVVNVGPLKPNEPSTAITSASVYAMRATDSGGQMAIAVRMTGISRGKSSRSGWPPSDQRAYTRLRNVGVR